MISKLMKYWHAHLAWISTLAILIWPHARILVAQAVASNPRISVIVAALAVFFAGISPSPLSRN